MINKAMNSVALTILFSITALLIAACGGGSSNAPPGASTGTNSAVTHNYFKTTVGSGWTYSDGSKEIITSNSNGILTSEKIINGERTVTTTAVTGSSIATVSSKTYDVTGALIDSTTYTPAYKFFPSSTALNFAESQTVAYTTSSTSGSATCSLTVKAVENVTVVAGIYQNALKVQSTCSNGSNFFTWFAPGVGIVKEEDISSGAIVQLTALPVESITHSVSGKITLASGTGVPGVTISTTGATATSDASGVYTLNGLISGTYTVTATKSGYTFSPSALTPYVNGADVPSQNFTAVVENPSSPPQPNQSGLSGIYVTSSGTLGQYPSSVVVFARNASGTDAPIRTLGGKATLMIDDKGASRRPWATFVDIVNNELVVADNGGALITTFSALASGNTAPIRFFTDGTNTGYSWSTPNDIFVDTVNNEIFVSSNQNGAISVFPRSSNSGLANSTPIRVISNSTLNPFGIAVDVANNEIYVANYGTHDISVFSRTANSLNAVPIRVIKGALTTISYPEGLAIDTVNNELFVICNGAPGTLVFSRTANGNVAPLRSFGFGGTGIAVDTINNEVFMVDKTNSISVFSRTATSSSTPLRTLTGPNSSGGLSLPQKIMVVP